MLVAAADERRSRFGGRPRRLAYACRPSDRAPGREQCFRQVRRLRPRAEEEGYGAVASLFRAASRAEKIHADNHAQVIRSMGGIPAIQVATPVAGATAENLKAAIEGESYERDEIYPEFLARARGAGLADAVQTFNYARTAEMEHAKLYQAALDQLDELKGSKAVTYYVCTVCGYTTMKIDFSKCPSCFNSRDKYVEVG